MVELAGGPSGMGVAAAAWFGALDLTWLPYAEAGRRWGFAAPGSWFDRLTPWHGPMPDAGVHTGAVRVPGDLYLIDGDGAGVFVVDGDLTVDGALRYRQDHAGGAVVVTGDLRVGHLLVERQARMLVLGAVHAAGVVVCDLADAAMVEVRGAVTAEATVTVVHDDVTLVFALNPRRRDRSAFTPVWGPGLDAAFAEHVRARAAATPGGTPGFDHEFAAALRDRRTPAAAWGPVHADPSAVLIPGRDDPDDRYTALRAGRPVLCVRARRCGACAQCRIHRRVAAGLDAAATAIDLAGRGLTRVPEEVFAAAGLRRLVLTDNPLTALPDRLGELAGLTHLDLAGTWLVELPAAVTALTGLTHLDLARTRLVDLSDRIGALGHLAALDLSDTPLTALPAGLGDLTRLTTLALRWFRGADLDVLTRLEALAELDLTRMHPHDHSRLAPQAFPPALTRLPRLRTLTLAGVVLADLPDALLDLTTLEELDLTGSLGARLTRLPDLARLPRLRVLRLSGSDRGRTSLPEPGTDRLWAITTLEELALARLAGDKTSRSPCTALPDDAFAQMPNLHRLDLSGNALTRLPESLYRLRHLDHLTLRYTRLDEATRRRLRDTFPTATIDLTGTPSTR